VSGEKAQAAWRCIRPLLRTRPWETIGPFAIAFACLAWAPAALAAPANDDFGNAQTLSGPLPIVAAGSNVEATKEAGEPGVDGSFDVEPAGHSVWFSWEASYSGWMTATTCGSGFDSLLDVYTGTALFGGLQKVARWREGPRFDCALGGSQVTFRAVAGTIYELRVDGSLSPQPPSATEGEIALEIAPTPPPANDSFAAAQTVVAESLEGGTFYRVDVPGFNWNATREAGEPAHGGDQGGASVWYSWTAPATGRANVVVVSAAFSSSLGKQDGGVLGVYAGDSLGGLTAVGAPGFSPQEVNLQVVAGATYRIAVDGRFDSSLGLPKMGRIALLIYLDAPNPPSAVPAPDIAPPRTKIVKRKVQPGKRRVTLTFGSNEPGTFRCGLDGRRAAPCSSPKRYTGLAPGRHAFRVYAVDVAGNSDPTPALARFSIARRASGRR
jgi:hypothetical protein